MASAAEAGKHVYCEKPFSVYFDDAKRMVDACNEHRVILQIAFMKRFNRSFQRVKEIIDEGVLGDLFEMRVVWDNSRFGATSENYRHRAASGGGYLQEDGSHPIDVCRWWMGDVKTVTGDFLIVDKERVENDDVGIVTMKHAGGGLSTLHITMRTHRTGDHRSPRKRKM